MRLPKRQVMQSEASTALMHLGGQIGVDALPLDKSCLSKSYNRRRHDESWENWAASDHMSIEVILTSGIDAEQVSSQSLYGASCILMPPCDGGGGGICNDASPLDLDRPRRCSHGSILSDAAMIFVCTALGAVLLSCRCMSDIILGTSLQLLAHELSLLEAQPPLH